MNSLPAIKVDPLNERILSHSGVILNDIKGLIVFYLVHPLASDPEAIKDSSRDFLTVSIEVQKERSGIDPSSIRIREASSRIGSEPKDFINYVGIRIIDELQDLLSISSIAKDIIWKGVRDDTNGVVSETEET